MEPTASDRAGRDSFAKHSFVIPAFGSSPYIGGCLESLRAQAGNSSIVIASPRPDPNLKRIADRFAVSLRVNPKPQQTIGADWNFALACAGTPWVTLAHQDDTYDETYSLHITTAIDRHPGAVLIATDYRELQENAPRTRTPLLRVKRALMELGFVGAEVIDARWRKLNTVRFGCAISCPTVAINVARTGSVFSPSLRNNLDWQAWISLAKRDGGFVYLRRQLMSHRIHLDSETTQGLRTGQRRTEDQRVLEGLWPLAIAQLIAGTYGFAYRNNAPRL